MSASWPTSPWRTRFLRSPRRYSRRARTPFEIAAGAGADGAYSLCGKQPSAIPQRLIRQLFELDADYVEALWGLDQPPGKLNLHAMLRDTLAALEQLPAACSRLRKNLPPKAHSILAQLEITIRKNLNAADDYNMVPGRNPQNG